MRYLKDEIMKDFNAQLLVYKQHHTNPMNRLMHYIGIPAIIFSTLMLLNWISLDIARTWIIPFSWFLVIAGLVYYYLLNIRLALLMTVIMIPLTMLAIWIARPTPTLFSSILFFILFLGGWILQFVGHYFEKTKPAFLDSIIQLLIAPLFLLLELLRALKLTKFFIE